MLSLGVGTRYPPVGRNALGTNRDSDHGFRQPALVATAVEPFADGSWSPQICGRRTTGLGLTELTMDLAASTDCRVEAT